ncbi:MAG: diaminopimelate decarboxylase [Dehalococcoidia bacterium]
MSRISLFPKTAAVNSKDHLLLGGCDSVALAAEFGTPLYVFDEATIRGKCAQYREEFARRYPDTLVIYACKAFINRALATIFKEEGLGLDVVSGGELAIAKSVDFPMERVYFHGNNKSRQELELAIGWGVGRIVVDNFLELSLLDEVAKEAGVRQEGLLRLSPGVDPHTHAFMTTGVIGSKFGFPMAAAEEALDRAMSASYFELIGFHFHIGSQVFELESYREAIAIVLRFAAEMRGKYSFECQEFSPGGGLALSYTEDSPAPTIAQFAEVISSTLLEKSRELSLEPPRLVIEPGRSIVGQAGVALYTVGATKEIPGLRKYVSVDGGMADNIRPALYGDRYEALVANKMGNEELERVTIAGKFCQSGDILIQDIDLPQVAPGDIIAIPSSGAYCLSMASNYNASLKPAIVLVGDGEARLIRRRESYEDLMSHDVA